MSVDVGSAVGYLMLDTSDFKSGFKSAMSDLKVFKDSTAKTEDKLTALSSAMTTAGKKMTTHVTLPIVGIGSAMVKTTAEFESGMSEVSAISGATGKDLEMLTDKAKEMGAKTKFSASESAEALKYMAMAGWDTQKMLGGLEGVMNLAAASGEELGTVSDIVTDALTAFGMKAEESAHFADILAKASSKSNTNVSMMGETFKYVAPVAGALGFTAEDTAIAIGLMANSGIKASQAGTSLRQILTNLGDGVELTGSKFGKFHVETVDAQGDMRDLKDILDDLREGFSDMTEAEKSANAETIAGKVGMSGLLAIVNASTDDYEKLAEEIYNCDGAAEQMADTMNDNLSGQITILKSTVEGIAISFGEIMLPAVKKLVKGLQNFATWINNLDERQKRMIVRIATLAATIGPLLLVGGKLLKTGLSIYDNGGQLLSLIFKTKNGWSGLFSVLKAHPYVALAAGIAAAGYALYKYIKKQHEASDAAKDFVEENEKEIESIDRNSATTNQYLKRIEELEGVEDKSNQQKILMQEYVDRLNESVEGLNITYDAEKDKLSQSTDEIRKNIEARKEQAIVNAYLEQSKKAMDNYADTVIKINDLEIRNSEIEKEKSDLINQYGEALAKQHPMWRQLISEEEKNKIAIDDLTESQKIYLQESAKAANMADLQSGKFAELSKQAQKAGLEIPQGLLDGIKSGEYIIPQTVEELGALIDFHNAAESADEDGKQVAENLKESMLAGNVSIKEASETLKKSTMSGIKEAPEESSKIGKKTSSKFASAISSKDSLEKAIKAGAKVAKKAKKGMDSQDGKEAGKKMGTDFANGLKGTGELIGSAAQYLAQLAQDALNSIKGKNKGNAGDTTNGTSGQSDFVPVGSYAKGLSYVPYDGFPAILHEGERVLTKKEAASYNNSAGNTFQFTFNSPEQQSPVEMRRQSVKAMKEILFSM